MHPQRAAMVAITVASLFGLLVPGCGSTAEDGDGIESPLAAVGDACSVTSDCQRDLYCQRPLGECEAPGVCAEPCHPYDCGGYCEVCGCDGITYGTDCSAYTEGVSLRHYGKCDGQPCGQDVECQGEGPGTSIERYCALPEGVCRGGD